MLFVSIITSALLAVVGAAAPIERGIDSGDASALAVLSRDAGIAQAAQLPNNINKRQDDSASGDLAQNVDVNNPVSDLAVNVVGGLEGGLTVLEGAVGQIAKPKKRQDDSASGDLAKNVDVNNPVADLAVNVVGGLEGGLEVLSGTLGQILKR